MRSEEKLPVDESEEITQGELPEDIESLKQALGEEKLKAEKYLANWQRAEADLANYKKRSEQERSGVIEFVNAELILSLLPVLDDLERALDSTPDELAELSWVNGIELVCRKLRDALEAHGLSEIKALEEVFDPRYHEAMMEGDGDEGKVIEVARKGYKLHDRVIRPARVIVGKGGEKKKNRE
jgi:molecular chaperone GrpE